MDALVSWAGDGVRREGIVKEIYATEISKYVLTLHQPWAWLVVNGHKKLENRPWRSHFTGKILIHASKRADCYEYDDLAAQIFKKHKITVPLFQTIDFGAMVGWAEFGPMQNRAPQSSRLAKWFTGPFAWPILDAVAFPQPCHKLRGYQRMWRTPGNLVLKIK